MTEEMLPYSFLITALKNMKNEGLDETQILPAFVNFSATLALRFGGEALLREAIVVMAHRHKDYRDGIFPPDASPQRKKPEAVTCQTCSRTVHEKLSNRGCCAGCEELARMAGLRVN